MADFQQEEVDISLETPAPGVFIAPSVNRSLLSHGASYTHYSAVPPTLLPQPNENDPSNTLPGVECCLGVDEAGRGPVLGPMVYGLFYLPLDLSTPLLRTTHHFDDSKVLKADIRSDLMEKLCTKDSDLYASCGWAVDVMSARDISSNMMKPGATYNLNAQAMDSTIALIQGAYSRGVNVKEIYIDTIGRPETYQKKLERLFPNAKVTVAKKADSLYPCVSAASVCAKVTRDAALEVLYELHLESEHHNTKLKEGEQDKDVEMKDQTPEWGSGYPSDVRCTGWLKNHMDPVFGWGSECRFSWGTVKDMLDAKGAAAKVEWPVEADEDLSRLTDFFGAEKTDGDELGTWFGYPATSEVF